MIVEDPDRAHEPDPLWRRRSAAGRGSDDSPFSCAGLPAFGHGALGWDYGNFTWHTERETYDKVTFDVFKSNATWTAMLVYLTSEDAALITRERVYLVKLAEERAAAAASSGHGASNAAA